MKPIEHLLVATDFSETANHALACAYDLAERLGAKVTVVHSYEIPIYGLPDGALVATADMVSAILDGANKGLAGIVDDAKSRKCQVRALLVQGPPEEAIDRAAKEIGADMIVVGTHGRRGLAHVLLGSVAERVLRTSSRPVLTVGPRVLTSMPPPPG